MIVNVDLQGHKMAETKHHKRVICYEALKTEEIDSGLNQGQISPWNATLLGRFSSKH